MAFTPRVKIALLSASVAAFFLVVLLVVLPTVLVNRPEIRAALQQRLSAMIGGELAFDMIKLTLLPRLCATVGHPRLDMPDNVSARAVDIDVCIKLLPLLRGRVVVDSIKVQAPEIHLPIAGIDSAGSGPGFPDPRLLLARMADWVKQVPESAIEIRDGRVELAGPGGHRFEFRKLALRFHHSGAGMEWALQGESDVLKAFSSRGRLETDSLKGTATFQATDFRPQPLQAFFLPESPFQILDSRLDLDLSVVLEGPGRATAKITGSAPTLAFAYNRREAHVSVDRFSAQLELSEKRLAVSISEFSARTPLATLELTFAIDEEAHPKIDIDLKGRGDLAGARDVTLAMLHEIPEALLVCDIMRSGDAPHIHVNLHGDSWDELADLNNLLIEGRLENGNVYIPWIDLDVNEVSGDVLIAGGILEGQGLKGHYKGTRGENGTLRVGLSSADPVLQLDIFARAELPALPSLLARIVPDPEFRKQVALVQGFSGTAQGTLRLDGTHTDVDVNVQASDLDVEARHQLIAYPIRFQGGEFAYDGNSITLRGVDLTIGNSKLFKHDLTIGLNGDLPLESSSPKAVVDVAEILNLFRDQPPFNDMRRLEGVLTFKDWQLRGQAFSPSTWMLVSAGTMQDLAFESELLPGLLSLPSGSFDWQGSSIRYESAKGTFNRSEIKELTVEADWTGPTRVQLRALELNASIADISQIMQSFPQTASYAAAFYPMNGTARMQDVRYQATLVQEGPRLDKLTAVLKDSVISSAAIDLPLTIASGEIVWQGSSLALNDLNVVLGTSSVRRLFLAFDWGAGDRFEIRTDEATVECGEIYPLLSLLPGLRGLREDVSGIEGNVEITGFGLSGRISGSAAWNLHADSRLNHMLITTTFLEEPIRVRLGRLKAEETAAGAPGGTVLHVEDFQTSTGSNRVMASGEIRLASEEIALDLSLTAESIDWNEIQTLSDRLSRRQPTEGRPVKGRIGLRAEAFKIGDYDFHPLVAEAVLTPGGTTVAIERADLCGIVLIGRLTFASGRLNAFIVPVADNTLLDHTLTCLSEEKAMASGRFNLDGALQVNAPPAEFLKALTGNLEAVSEDGRFLRSNLFAKILGLINITEIYRGTLPDLTGEGLEYKRMKLSSEFRDGKLVVNGWSLDGPSLWMGARGEINLIDHTLHLFVLVSPFKTVDRIINSIPGLRWILGGRLVAIPMEARGDLSDPEVIPMAPTAVAQSLLDLLGRTIRLPLHIIQPLIPGLDESVDIDGDSIVKRK